MKVSTAQNTPDRLLTLRQKLRPSGEKLSQSELAMMLGFSRNYVAMVEGGRKPGRKFLAALAALEEYVRTGEHDGRAEAAPARDV